MCYNSQRALLVFPANISFSMAVLHRSILLLIIPLLFAPTQAASEGRRYAACSRSFTCSNLDPLDYPFWGGEARPSFCGLPSFQLRCVHGRYAVINIGGLGYRVIDVDQPQSTLRIARLDTWDDICRPRRANTTFPNNSSFTPLYSTSQNISIFYGCPLDLRLPAENNFSCPANGSRCTNFFGDQGFVTANPSNLSRCGLRVDVVVQSGALQTLYVGRASLNETLREGFDARYVAPTAQDCPACRASGGVCGSDPAWSQLACHCRNGTLPRVCLPATSGKKRDWVLKTIIGVVAAVVGMGLACLAVFIYQRRRKNRFVLQSSLLPRSLSSSGPSPKTAGSEKGGIHAGVHIFTYDELEEATNNFDSTKELGDGGFGAVYHGKLRDGRCVAVKRLYENNYRRLEQFMNEVEILTRLRHKNLVSLYGSTSGQSRELLLVYEFVANGTVASHLHGDRATAGALSWTVRMSIAAETASALTYLHFSEIVHRDVKTDNILLDENFCVKVADFGLSRLFPTQVTHVSTAPQGTPGYVDPEYHQCYQLTSKSDVYSFGVVLVELLSSKPAVDITRHRQEINLANMAMTKIQNNSLHELVDPSLGFETDGKVRRMVEAVAELAFQCLQSEKEMRPSMEEVLETLRRTQKEGFGVEDGESPADDTAPLRRKPPPIPPSPDSVTATWVSTSTTPNASG